MYAYPTNDTFAGTNSSSKLSTPRLRLEVIFYAQDTRESSRKETTTIPQVIKTALFFSDVRFPPALDKNEIGTPRVQRVLKDVSMMCLRAGRQHWTGHGEGATHLRTEILESASRYRMTSKA